MRACIEVHGAARGGSLYFFKVTFSRKVTIMPRQYPGVLTVDQGTFWKIEYSVENVKKVKSAEEWLELSAGPHVTTFHIRLSIVLKTWINFLLSPISWVFSPGQYYFHLIFKKYG